MTIAALLFVGLGLGQGGGPVLSPDSPKKQGPFELIGIQRPTDGSGPIMPGQDKPSFSGGVNTKRFFAIVRTQGLIRDQSKTVGNSILVSLAGVRAQLQVRRTSVELNWRSDHVPGNLWGQTTVAGQVDIAVEIPELYPSDIKEATLLLESEKGHVAKWTLAGLPKTTMAEWSKQPSRTTEKIGAATLACPSFSMTPAQKATFTPWPRGQFVNALLTISDLDPNTLYRLKLSLDLPASEVAKSAAIFEFSGPSRAMSISAGNDFGCFADHIRVWGMLEKIAHYDERIEIPALPIHTVQKFRFAMNPETVLKTTSGLRLSAAASEETLERVARGGGMRTVRLPLTLPRDRSNSPVAAKAQSIELSAKLDRPKMFFIGEYPSIVLDVPEDMVDGQWTKPMLVVIRHTAVLDQGMFSLIVPNVKKP